jgi:hypothetical protein
VVQSARGKSVTLTDGTTQRRDKILMVPHYTFITPTTEKNYTREKTSRK